MSKAQELLKAPLIEWPERAEKLDIQVKQEVENELSAVIQRATLLEAYVARRWNTGCGDQGHSSSAKHANNTLVKVRRALGYTYPERGMVIR